MKDYVTTAEAAAMLGRDSSRIRHLIRDGLLRSELVGGVHLLRRRDVEKFTLPKRGRPKSSQNRTLRREKNTQNS